MRYNGIPVGRVAEIKLDPQDPTRVRATIELEGAAVVKSDAVASLELQGLTGGTFINITGGSRDAPPLTRQTGQRYPVIASRPSGLQQVVTSAPEALARLIALTDQLNDVLSDQNRQAISETLDNLRKSRRRRPAIPARSTAASPTAPRRCTICAPRSTRPTHPLALDQRRGAGAMQHDRKSVDDATRNSPPWRTHLDGSSPRTIRSSAISPRRGFDQLEQLLTQSQQLVAQLDRIADAIERDPVAPALWRPPPRIPAAMNGHGWRPASRPRSALPVRAAGRRLRRHPADAPAAAALYRLTPPPRRSGAGRALDAQLAGRRADGAGGARYRAHRAVAQPDDARLFRQRRLDRPRAAVVQSLIVELLENAGRIALWRGNRQSCAPTRC